MSCPPPTRSDPLRQAPPQVDGAPPRVSAGRVTPRVSIGWAGAMASEGKPGPIWTGTAAPAHRIAPGTFDEPAKLSASGPGRPEAILGGACGNLRCNLILTPPCSNLAYFETMLDVAGRRSCPEKPNKNNNQVGRETLQPFKSRHGKV